MRETGPDMQKTSPWLIAARVIFTFALIACIVFIFSNSMQIGDVSETASGRVLLLMKKVFTRLGMPGAANHLTDHIVRKLAHFCEYALEGFLLTLCLRVYTRHFFVHISWPILGGGLPRPPANGGELPVFPDGGGPDGRDHPDVQRWPEQPAHRRLAGFFGCDGRYSGGPVLSGPVQDVLAALQTSKRGLTQ